MTASVPAEGSTGWSDTWMMYSKAKNPNCMYLWMDHIASADVQKQVASWFGEAPANLKACDALEADEATKGHCDTFHAKDDAYLKAVQFWRVPLADCGDDRGDTCKDYDAWVKAWSEIKG